MTSGNLVSEGWDLNLVICDTLAEKIDSVLMLENFGLEGVPSMDDIRLISFLELVNSV